MIKDLVGWDEYLMRIALIVAIKSKDPSSQYGCVAVSQSNNILSSGYNGPPRNVNDSRVPLTRPDKYIFMEHAERNCIYNAARVGTPLENCKFYVTGIPCTDCLRAMYQVGASEVICLNVESNSTTDEWYKFIEFISIYMKVRTMEIK